MRTLVSILVGGGAFTHLLDFGSAKDGIAAKQRTVGGSRALPELKNVGSVEISDENNGEIRDVNTTSGLRKASESGSWGEIFEKAFCPSFEEGWPRRSNNATLPQEIGAAGEVRRSPYRLYDGLSAVGYLSNRGLFLPYCEHVLSRPSSKEGQTDSVSTRMT